MKLGILSDIHGNIEALTAAHGELKKNRCDRVVCLGDVVGYGANPGECIDFIREKEIFTVRGNHDHYVIQNTDDWQIQPYAQDAILWTRDVLNEGHKAWLRSLPFNHQIEEMTLIHASMEALDGEYWPYILGTRAAMFHFFLQPTKIAFFGHTHIPLLFSYHQGKQVAIEMLKSKKLDTQEGDERKFLINPGSVGQPRDFDNRSSCLIYDSDKHAIQLIRKEYDIRATQRKIEEAGLPAILSTRLSRGN